MASLFKTFLDAIRGKKPQWQDIYKEDAERRAQTAPGVPSPHLQEIYGEALQRRETGDVLQDILTPQDAHREMTLEEIFGVTPAKPEPTFEGAASPYTSREQLDAALQDGSWVFVVSSNVTAFRYLIEKAILEIEFHGGGKQRYYQFFGVPYHIARGLGRTWSPGRWVWRHIRGQYDYVRLPGISGREAENLHKEIEAGKKPNLLKLKERFKL